MCIGNRLCNLSVEKGGKVIDCIPQPFTDTHEGYNLVVGGLKQENAGDANGKEGKK